VRVIAAVAGALVVTAAIFGLMDRMISQDRTRLVNTLDAQPIEFVRTEVDEQTKTKDRRRKPPPKPQEMKRVRSEVEASVTRTDALPQDFAAYNVSSLLGEGSGVGLGQSLLAGSGESMAMVMASDLTPLAMLPPQYPPAALMRGTEGWVRVLFLVTEEGLVEDPVVIEAEPKNVFNNAATAAVSRWRFRPVIRDGEPVAVRAQVKVDFDLPDE